MAKRVRITNNIRSFINDVTTKKIPRTLLRITDLGRKQAAVFTPIATKILINSSFRTIRVDGTLYTGRVGYSASYAVYVHDPKVIQKFKRPEAKKEFLTEGFEVMKPIFREVIAEEMKP
ncbi:HK97 gp10 family phage protein [Providencia rettgeri]